MTDDHNNDRASGAALLAAWALLLSLCGMVWHLVLDWLS